MDRRKLFALAIIFVFVSASVLAFYAFYRRVTSSTAILADVYINGKKVVSGGRWLVNPQEIFAVGGKPLADLKIVLKLRWNVKSLGPLGGYTQPSSTDVKMIAIAFWKIDGYFGYCGLSGCHDIGYDHATTIHYTKSEYSGLEYIIQLFSGMNPNVGRMYASIIYPSGTGFQAVWIASERMFGLVQKQYINDLIDNTVIPLMKTPGKIYKVKIPPSWIDEVLTGTQPNPIKLKDGSIQTIYTLHRAGWELQGDLASMVFGKSGFDNYVLITDNSDMDFKISLWVFIAYQWKDLNGKWTPLFQGVNKLVEFSIDVTPGYWQTVSVTATATGNLVQGEWTLPP